jgi:hypothetical protein
MNEHPAADDYMDVPEMMLAARRWLVWKSISASPGKKPRKVPFYATGQPRAGSLDSPDDAARLVSFDEAIAALGSGAYAGLGFALGRDGNGHWQGVDLDDIETHPGLRFIADNLPGYVERSPSGRGLHAIGYGEYFQPLGPNGTGIEAYSGGRFFTVTGASASFGYLIDLSDFTKNRLAQLHGPAMRREPSKFDAPEIPAETLAELAPRLGSALNAIRADDRADWVSMGMALKGLGETGRDLWLEWSQTSDKYDADDATRVWDSLDPQRTGYGAVFKRAQAAGWNNPNEAAAIGQRVKAGNDGALVDLQPAPLFDPWEPHLGPPFPRGILPPVLDKFATYVSTVTGADHAGCAMAALTACGGAIDQQTTLKMKRTGDWVVRASMWTLLVGDPGTAKSPAINACIKPLRRIENTFVQQWQRDHARWLAIPKAERGDEPPPPTRYLGHDLTSEKLGEILSRQDRGLLYTNDELSSWIGLMDKHGGGRGSAADRGVWAKAYDGGAYAVDRIHRGSVFVQNLSVGIIGGIQPDRLPQVATLASDGLLQRFLPVMMRRPNFSREVEDDHPAEAYDALLSYLSAMKPFSLVMDEGARQAAEEFQRFIFDLVEADAHGKGFATFAGKLPGVHGRLSLLLHVVENPKQAPFDPVPERIVRNAARLVQNFIIPHALQFYRSVGDAADWASIQTICSFVLTTERTRFRPSDFTNGVRALAGLGTWDLAKRISPLVAGGWLVEEDGGGVARAWNLAPGLREHFKERRKTEIDRKAAALRALRSSQSEDGK